MYKSVNARLARAFASIQGQKPTSIQASDNLFDLFDRAVSFVMLLALAAAMAFLVLTEATRILLALTHFAALNTMSTILSAACLVAITIALTPLLVFALFIIILDIRKSFASHRRDIAGTPDYANDSRSNPVTDNSALAEWEEAANHRTEAERHAIKETDAQFSERLIPLRAAKDEANSDEFIDDRSRPEKPGA